MSGPQVTCICHAEDEDGKDFTISIVLGPSNKLHDLAITWAKAHNIPSDAVGLEDMKGHEFNLDMTPSELGWKNNIDLYICPVLDAFAEHPCEGERVAQEKARDGCATKHQSEKGDRAAQEKAGDGCATKHRSEKSDRAPQEKARDGCATKHQSEKGDRAAQEKARDGCATKHQIEEGDRAAQERCAQDGLVEAACSSHPAKKAPSADPPDRQPERTPAATSESTAETSSSAAGSQAKATADDDGRPAKRPKAERPPANLTAPTGRDPVSFLQNNPKMVGSRAWERYEEYKRATTVTEALSLGASKGDISNDFKKGFLVRS